MPPTAGMPAPKTENVILGLIQMQAPKVSCPSIKVCLLTLLLRRQYVLEIEVFIACVTGLNSMLFCSSCSLAVAELCVSQNDQGLVGNVVNGCGSTL